MRRSRPAEFLGRLPFPERAYVTQLLRRETVGGVLPSQMRAFLLTLAVVDDLVAIVLIAVFYSDGAALVPLAGSGAALAFYALLQRRHVDAWPVLVVPALLAWGLMHASGVHPTVAGVALGLLTRAAHETDGSPGPVERFAHRWQPLSAALAVPLFALLSAGISVSIDALEAAAHDRAAVGVVVARIAGKTIGVFVGAYLVARLTAARLNPSLDWADVFGVAVLAGIGFAVPLLVSDVAFGAGSPLDERVTAGILAAALLAACAGAIVLRLRHRHYEQLYAAENLDEDGDGVPDVYQEPPPRAD